MSAESEKPATERPARHLALGLSLTAMALIAFAANSLLCRTALRGDLIDPTTFTGVRLLSGAVTLSVVSRLVEPRTAARRSIGGTWLSAAALFAYAIAFSWAYVTLDTGTGALVLFGAVQATMIGVGMLRGERPRTGEWLGLVLATSGLVYLVLPGLSAPDPLGVALMAIAGAAWGAYSLWGRAAVGAVRATAGNFLRSAPLALAALAIAWPDRSGRPAGFALAVVSGALTSGLGYVVWYRALRELAATTAAIVQLLVPVLAAAGGVLLLAERPTLRLLLAALLILGGITTAILSRR